MGKKAREKREKERESFVKRQARKKIQTKLIAGGVIAAVSIIVAYSAIIFAQNQYSALGAPPNAGPLGSEHSHIAMMAMIFGKPTDFALQSFQVKNSFIHFEGLEGFTIHKHATGVSMGYFLETLGIKLDDQCIIMHDGRELCTNEDYSLKFYVNHEEMTGLYDYVGDDGDRILISYGSEDEDEIEAQLRLIDVQPLNQ